MILKALSDLHGRLPHPDELGNCDVLLIAGDVCPITGDHSLREQARFMNGPYKDWCESLQAGLILATPGNHDYIEERVGKAKGFTLHRPENYRVLIDEGFEVPGGGPKVWGSPWVPNLPLWAFHGTNRKLEELAEETPEGYDVWLQHGPPWLSKIPEYRLDLVGREHVGNAWIARAIIKKQPQLFVCGHIHGSGIGMVEVGPEHYPAMTRTTTVANVAFMDDHYDPVGTQLVVDWDPGARSFSDITLLRPTEPVRLAWDCVAEGWP